MQPLDKFDTLNAMKQYVLRLLILLSAVICLLPLKRAGAAAIDKGVITGSSVALRQDPDGGSKVLTRLKTGTYVEILKTNVNAEWYEVSYRELTGYVNRVYVNIEPSLDAYQYACDATIANCETEINVRKSASASSTILGKAKKGERYPVIKQYASAGWHAIQFGDELGYVAAEYTELSPIVNNDQLAGLEISGGSLSPNFSPAEYGYVVMAEADTVRITAEANAGVTIDMDGSGQSELTLDTPSGSARTVRIQLDGETRYTVFVVRDALIIGSWNIKRGNNRLIQQARLVETQQPDVMALQEVFNDPSADPTVDNLKSLRTKRLKYSFFTPTLRYASGAQYGIGILSGLKILSSESIALTSLNKEPRSMQKIVFTYEGRRISLYNTHFSYESSTIRIKQFQETLAILERDENRYKILVGDFNARAWEFEKIKGYRVLNNSDTVFYGYDGEAFKRTTVDNIIVSSSFQVLDIRMIDTQLSDHKPLFAYLTLNGEG